MKPAGRSGWSRQNAYRILRFVALASLLLALYSYPSDEGSARTRFFSWYLSAYARAAAAALRLFEPQVTSAGQDIVGRGVLRIVKGCDAIDVLIAVVAAILVFPCRWRDRLRALPIAVALVVALNLFRICTLYFLQIHAPATFEFVHMQLWPLLLVLVAGGGFATWGRWVSLRTLE